MGLQSSKPTSRSTRTQSNSSRASLSSRRIKPNILIIGTPGTGKTTTASALEKSTLLHHINIVDLVKTRNLHDEYDNKLNCYIIKKTRVFNALESTMELGGVIVDYHSCDPFPKSLFDLVVVLQTDKSVLYDRLTQRGYSGSKLGDNIECEIAQVILKEARGSYRNDIVKPLNSNQIDDIGSNVETIVGWLQSWQLGLI